MGKSEKSGKPAEKKPQLNQWNQFRSSTAAQKKMEYDSRPVELGQGGIKFVRDGERTFALPCGDVPENDTMSAVRVSYDILAVELSKVRVIVRRGKITGRELRKQFSQSTLQAVADQQIG